MTFPASSSQDTTASPTWILFLFRSEHFREMPLSVGDSTLYYAEQ